jgi:hypothetical protein
VRATGSDEDSAGRCGEGENIAGNHLTAELSAPVAIICQASSNFTGGLNANSALPSSPSK